MSNAAMIAAADSAMLQAVFADHPHGMLVVEPGSLRIVLANHVACDMLGYTSGQLQQLEITTVESSIENIFYWDDVRRGELGPVTLDDGYYQCSDGSVLAVQKRISVIASAVQPLLLVCFQKIAETLSIQDALSRSTSLLSATLEATADGILVTRVDGGISNMNHRFAQMWGIPDALIDAGIDADIHAYLQSEVLHPDAYAAHLQEVLHNTDGDSLDVIELTHDRFFERYTTPLQVEGCLSGFVFSFRDVTGQKRAEHEQKRYEASLRVKNQELEKANRVKSEFLANMSHEIRTPMSAIIGLARLCLATELTAQQRDYVEKLFQSGQSLLGIINDILDFSKIEAGKLTMESIAFDMDKVFERVQQLASTMAQDRRIELIFDTQLPAPYTGLSQELVGDPLRLGQVLLNLVSNAIKFTEHGTVRVTVLPVQVMAEQVELQFTVKDTGIGMSEEQCGRMFQSFSQADTSTTRRYGGTGLGLAICKSLVALMQGDISVTSQLNVGSTFIFTASFGRAAPIVSDDAASQDVWQIQVREELRGARVLIVEDNLINQQIASELLQHAGLVPAIADNGQEALQLLARQPFDAVLMDMQMPVMDGIDATIAIRAMPEFARLPIIAMTANTMSGDDERCIAAGMNDHVPKPVDPERLFAVLGKWIAGQR